MERHTDNVQDLVGNAVDGVTVTVRRTSDASLASIFSDNLAVPTAKANPFTNDADGELFFYAPNDEYEIILSGPVTETRSGVRLFDSNDTGLRTGVQLITGNTNAVPGNIYLCDVSGGAFTVTLPLDLGSNLQRPDIEVRHLVGDVRVNPITIARNSELIGGVAADVIMNRPNQAACLTWGDSTDGWAIQNVSTDGVQEEIKENQTDRNNDATLTDDPDLAGFVLDEDTYYKINAYLEFRNGAAAGGVRFALQLSQASQDDGWSYHAADAAGANVQDQLLVTATVLQTLAGNIINAFTIRGYVRTNATGQTTADLQWGQNVSDATATSLLRGSWIEFIPKKGANELA